MPVGRGERLSDVAARAPHKPAVTLPSKVAWAKCRRPPRLTEADRRCTGATWWDIRASAGAGQRRAPVSSTGSRS